MKETQHGDVRVTGGDGSSSSSSVCLSPPAPSSVALCTASWPLQHSCAAVAGQHRGPVTHQEEAGNQGLEGTGRRRDRHASSQAKAVTHLGRVFCSRVVGAGACGRPIVPHWSPHEASIEGEAPAVVGASDDAPATGAFRHELCTSVAADLKEPKRPRRMEPEGDDPKRSPSGSQGAERGKHGEAKREHASQRVASARTQQFHPPCNQDEQARQRKAQPTGAHIVVGVAFVLVVGREQRKASNVERIDTAVFRSIEGVPWTAVGVRKTGGRVGARKRVETEGKTASEGFPWFRGRRG